MLSIQFLSQQQTDGLSVQCREATIITDNIMDAEN